jgi:hypothetical protein
MTGQAILDPAQAEPPPPARSRMSRRVRLLGLLCGVALVAAVFAVVRWQPDRPAHSGDTQSKVPVSWQRPVVSAAHLAERSGVKITQVSVTGGGGLVDLRFQVIDPEQAAALHEATTPPAVVDEKTGLVVHDLLMSHSHSGPFKAGITYYLIFNNPGNFVHRGSQVTVLLGDAQVEHVDVT